MRRLAAAVAFALATGPGPAHAQGALSLSDAYRLARAQNLDLVAARAQVAAAGALVRQAWSALLPQVAGQAAYTVRDEETVAALGGPGAPPLVIAPRDDLSAQLTVRQVLFDRPAQLQVASARDAHAAARLDAERAAREVTLATAGAWYAVVTARRVVAVNQALLPVAQANLEVARARREAGRVLTIDVTRAELDVETARRQIAVATAALADARDALALLVGSDQPVDAAEPARAPPAGVPGDGATRPELRAAALRTRIAERGERAAWWSLAPTLDARFALTWTDDAGALGRDTQWQAMATLSVPLYDGGLRYAAIRRGQAETAAARAQAGQLRRTVTHEVRAARRAVDTQAVVAATAARQVELARAALAQAEAAYREGASTNLEVIAAQQTLRDAEVGVVVAEAEWQLAGIRLQVAAGEAPR